MPGRALGSAVHSRGLIRHDGDALGRPVPTRIQAHLEVDVIDAWAFPVLPRDPAPTGDAPVQDRRGP
jgi:hypothetical protein